ncbi:MAG: glycosyltransferase [Candidatus Marinimicrobia bacterium]|nr:glycosyltransferase [Candidatus Neomarinimicrobiota bacterium]
MVALIIAIGYYIIFLLLAYGFSRTRTVACPTTAQKASVIICARNEEQRILPLLTSLEKIEYPIENYEVLLVDDQSSDHTAGLLSSFAANHKNWVFLQHIKNNQSYKGKKGALDFGIQNSRYDIILTTDADCTIKPGWLQSMLSCFEKDTALVQGYSPVVARKDFLSIYQQFDTLAEGVTAAASMFFNHPTHANARNFAFRKAVYESLGGFSRISHVDTGDDFYLAQLIQKETLFQFCFNPDTEAFVYTEEVNSLKEYWHQQLRRNSKGFDLSREYLLLGGWLLLFHGLLLYMVISGQVRTFSFLMAGKLMAEFFVVLLGALRFHEKRVLFFFPILWVLYPLGYFSSQILGAFKIYRWK